MHIEDCFGLREAGSSAVLFYPGGIECECWSMSQFLRCRVEANPAAKEDRNAPPEMLTAFFAIGRVILTGRGLDHIAQKLQAYELTKIKVSSSEKGEGTRVTIASIRFELDEPSVPN